MAESAVPDLGTGTAPGESLGGAPGAQDVDSPEIESSQDEGTDSEPEKRAAPKPPEKQKFRLKVKEKQGDREIEREEEIDEDTLREWRETHAKRREHARAASQRMEEAAKSRKEIEGLLEGLKSDPMRLYEIAKMAGLDPDEVAASYAQKWVAEREMTPEQKAMAAREQTIAQREQKMQQWQAEREQEAQTAQMRKFQQDFASRLPALSAKYGLPDDPFTGQDIAKVIASQLEAGDEPDFDAAADIVSERLEGAVQSHLKRLSQTPGALAKKYPDLVERLRKEGLELVTRAPEPNRPTGKQTPRPAPKEKRETWEEYEHKTFLGTLGSNRQR